MEHKYSFLVEKFVKSIKTKFCDNYYFVHYVFDILKNNGYVAVIDFTDVMVQQKHRKGLLLRHHRGQMLVMHSFEDVIMLLYEAFLWKFMKDVNLIYEQDNSLYVAEHVESIFYLEEYSESLLEMFLAFAQYGPIELKQSKKFKKPNKYNPDIWATSAFLATDNDTLKKHLYIKLVNYSYSSHSSSSSYSYSAVDALFKYPVGIATDFVSAEAK